MIKKGTIIHSITIKNYWKSVIISKAKKKKYYTRDDVLPQKYMDRTKYKYSSSYLINIETGENVIKNAKSAGKPRVYTLSGQDLWASMNFHLRSKVSKELKKYFYDHVSSLEPLQEDLYPVGVRLKFYDEISGEDLDNLSIWYRKTIHDALCGNVEYVKNDDGKYIPIRKNYKQILVDDSKEYVQSIPTEFYPIKDTEKRKLIIEIFKI